MSTKTQFQRKDTQKIQGIPAPHALPLEMVKEFDGKRISRIQDQSP
jgi:hypothetical protein